MMNVLKEYEKELDEFLAGDDGLESKPWLDYVAQIEKPIAEGYREIISRRCLDELIRVFAKSYVAHLKSKRMAEAILASTKMAKVKKIRSGFIQAAKKTISNVEAVSEVFLTHVEEELIPAAEKGKKFKPARPKGSRSKKTKYIHKLATDKPNEKALALYLEADKNIIGKMSEGTFANHVSEARNPKPKS